jgi:hypothetical protein
MTGMHPQMAQQLVAEQVELSGFAMHSTLAEGLRDALRRLGLKVARRADGRRR